MTAAETGRQRWRLGALDPPACTLLWPLVTAAGESVGHTAFCRWLRHWRRAREGRRIFGLGYGAGPLLAGFLLDPPGDGTRAATVERLWWIEPGRDGVVVRAVLAALPLAAETVAADGVRLPRHAIADGEARRRFAGAAAIAGYIVDGEGWRWVAEGRRVDPVDVRWESGSCELSR